MPVVGLRAHGDSLRGNPSLTREVIVLDNREQGPRQRLTVAAAFYVAWNCAVIAFVGLVLLGLVSPRRDAPLSVEEERGSGKAALREDGDVVRVSLDIARGDASSALVVEDREGREVVVVHLHRAGKFVLETGREAPVNAVVHATSDGGLYVGVCRKEQDAQLGLLARPDGTNGFEVRDRRFNDVVLGRWEITGEGKALRPPSAP
jgi:hypothetical protein